MTDVTKVPLLDLQRLDASMLDELRATFDRVLTSGRYIMGPEVTSLEEECAAYIGAKEAIGVSSGTDALVCVLMALDIGAGDEVICPTYTFFATAGSIWRTGARPVLVDCDPWSYNWDDTALESAITERTKALMPIHLFGQAAPTTRALELAQDRGLAVIEDAAQAIGVSTDAGKVGTLGQYGCFSFFPSKNLGCLGDGGLITTNDAQLAERARIMRAHGGKPKYHHHVVGGNFRIDALQAALLRIKLPHLEQAHTRRRENASLYRQLLTEAGVAADQGTPAHGTPDIPPGKIGMPTQVAEDHIYNQFTLRVTGDGNRDALRAFLAEKNIGTEVYYPIPMHLQKCFADLGHKPGDFPAAEAAARETLAIPIFPELTRDEIHYVVDQIAAWCKTTASQPADATRVAGAGGDRG